MAITNDIQLATAYNVAVTTRKSKVAVYVQDMVHNLSIDNLGDDITDNQILIKQLHASYRRLQMQIVKNDNNMLDKQFNIVDRTVSPSYRVWVCEDDNIIRKIRRCLDGDYKNKWVLDEGDAITANSLADVTTNPWDTIWESNHILYGGYNNIFCKKAVMPVWGVIALSDVVGDIGSGTPGPGIIQWEEV